MAAKITIAGISILSVMALFLLFGCVQNPICGNDLCELGETSVSCPNDCNGSAQNPGTADNAIQQIVIPPCVAPSGNDIYTAGFVSGVCADCATKGSVGGNSDNCITQLPGGQKQIVQSSNQLLKFYCTPEGWARKIVDCPNGCNMGACKH